MAGSSTSTSARWPGVRSRWTVAGRQRLLERRRHRAEIAQLRRQGGPVADLRPGAVVTPARKIVPRQRWF